jgi:hypothetical protein
MANVLLEMPGRNLHTGFSSANLRFAENQQNQQKSAKNFLLILRPQNSKTNAYCDILVKTLSIQRKLSNI